MKKYRKDFPILKKKIDNKNIIYLDSAATSLKPIQVINKINEFYFDYTANIHRGIHKLSEQASNEYDKAHENVASLINSKPEEIIFTKNATESINLLMYSFLQNKNFKKGNEIIVSKVEHHSNLIPWQILAKLKNLKLKFIKIKDDFTIDLEDLKKKMTKKTKLVSITHASNVTGAITNIKEVEKIVHNFNSLLCIDSAHGVPNLKINIKKSKIDFMCFSGHKMLGPSGTGALFGKKELLDKMNPFIYGGGMIKSASLKKAEFANSPDRFEAGTPHIAGGIGLGEAAKYLKKVGMNNIREHEMKITKIALNKMQNIENVKIFTPNNEKKQTGLVSFSSDLMQCHEIGMILDEMENIAVRTGYHCVQPFIEPLCKDGFVRASFYFYTTKEEVNLLANNVEEILKQTR